MEDSIFDDAALRIWHGYWQAAVGRNLLSTPTLAHRIRSRLLAAHRAPQRKLFYFLLTRSEIHLLTALPASDKPNSVAHGVANVVARWVREADGLHGPVFAGPFHARGINSAEQLLQEVRMLAWRPVSLGLSVAPTHYRHSALRCAVGLDWVQGFDASALYQLLGTSVPEARSALRALVADRPSELEVRHWELEHGIALASGPIGPLGLTTRQVRGAAAVLVAASETKSIAGALALLELWVAVKLRVRDGQNLVVRKDHQAARLRALVANLAVQLGLCSAGALARHYGRAKATLSEQMLASRGRPRDRQILAIPLTKVVEEALAVAIDEKRAK